MSPCTPSIARQAPGRGSATEAASSISAVLNSESVLDPTLRPEEFTLAKEQRTKDRGAEIITVDQSYNPGTRPGARRPPSRVVA